MDQHSKIFVFVLPVENQEETLIEFEYFGSGLPYQWYEGWYYKLFTGSEEKENLFIWVVSGLGVISCLFCSAIIYCIRQYCCKKSKADPSKLYEMAEFPPDKFDTIASGRENYES